MRKNIIKKVMAALMCGSLIISSNGVLALADESTKDIIYETDKEYKYGDFYYMYLINNKGICITGYVGDKEKITIPKKINNRKITKINMDNKKISEKVKVVSIPETGQITDISFNGCDKLENVNIPEGVSGISECAFMNCVSLKKIEIPPSVIGISKKAFYNSGIEQASMSYGVIGIGEEAFKLCKALRKIIIPDSVTTIFKNAFQESGIKSVAIGNSNKIIQEGAFKDCNELSKVELSAALKSIQKSAFMGCNKLKKVTIPKGAVYIRDAFSAGTEINFESPYMKKYRSIEEDENGKNYNAAIYIKGVDVNVKGKYCYKEAEELLKEINQKREEQRLDKIGLSYDGQNAAMERALYLGVANIGRNRRPDQTKFKYKLPSQNVVKGTKSSGKIKSKEEIIEKIMGDENFKECKSIGVGCVEEEGKKYFYIVADKNNLEEKENRIYKSGTFSKNISVRGDYISRIDSTGITLKKGRKTTLNIRAKLNNAELYHMKRYSAGRITMNNLKIKSLNKKIVKTDKKGVITGVKRGTAKLKVSLKMNGKCSTVIRVKVV